MGICWYCSWGWPKVTADIYEKYYKLVGDTAMDYGPGHIVWSDENFETDNIQWCIDNAQKYRRDMDDKTLALVVESLKELLAIPEEIRCCEPKDYDEWHPENYPPPAHIEMQPKRFRMEG
jgi:hypothetical protein